MPARTALRISKLRALKNILRQGLDLQPLPSTVAADPLPEPHFARSMSELLHTKKDTKNELN